jgi:hypothetical protein
VMPMGQLPAIVPVAPIFFDLDSLLRELAEIDQDHENEVVV